MSRIWWATISGLILGGVLFGMMQRGCESTADPSLVVSPLAASSSTSVLTAAIAPMAPTSRLPQSLLTQAEPASDLRSTFGAITSVMPRPAINVGADGVREGSQQLSSFRSADSEFGNASQQARQRAERSAQAQRDRQARMVNATRMAQDAQAARLRAGVQQQQSLVTIGAAGELPTALQAQELIRSRLLEQIRRDRQRGVSADSGDPRSQSPNSNGGDPSSPDSPGVNPNDSLNAGRGAAVTQNSIPGGGAGTVLPNTGATFTNPGATIPFNPTPIGDTAAGDGSTPGAGGVTTTGDGGGIAPPPPFIIPPTGTGNTGGGSTPPSNEPAVIARWAPVETDSACSDLSGTRTNDLFVGFSSPLNLQIVTSAPPLSLNIQGGSFIQNSLGDNEQPSLGALALDSCVAFDSYLAIGDERDLLMIGILDPVNWGSSLNIVWGTPLSSPFGVAGVQDSARFGDDRYYVRIGRFTATGNPDFVGGTVLVNALNPATFSFTTEIVPVLFDAVDWAVEGAGGPILSTLSFDAPSAVGGIVTGATVTISSPAPDAGVEVGLTSTSALLSVPTSVVIPPGQTSVRFNVNTSAVEAPNIATLYAFLNGKVVRASVTLKVPVGSSLLDTLAISPEIVRGGLTATGTVTLDAPASVGGVVVNLSSDDLSIANVPPNVLVPEGQTQATFEIQTAVMTAPQSLLIWAKNGEQVRTASLTVTIPSDLTGDGLVNAADLAQLLGNWNTSDPNADLNGNGVVNGNPSDPNADINRDGVVDAADLAILLGTFHDATGVTPFTGAAIARWIPVAIPAQCGLSGQRTNDLYLGFESNPEVVIVTSLGDTQLFMTGGVVHQDVMGSNSPPSDFFVNLFPCLAYDSYLTLGGAAPTFLPGTALDSADWGSALTASWFTLDFGSVVVEHDPVKFGDSRFYMKIARITATEGVRIEGDLTVDFFVDGAGQPTTLVPVTHCPVCWKSFDLNGDGVVDAADVNFVMAMLGTNDPLTDLNSDGIVTAADVALIIDQASAKKNPVK